MKNRWETCEFFIGNLGIIFTSVSTQHVLPRENGWFGWVKGHPTANGVETSWLEIVRGRMFHRKISWSLEAARFIFRPFQSLWNLTGTSAAALSRCLSNFRAILSLWHPISWHRSLRMFYGKTPVRLVSRDPVMGKMCLRHDINICQCHGFFSFLSAFCDIYCEARTCPRTIWWHFSCFHGAVPAS